MAADDVVLNVNLNATGEMPSTKGTTSSKEGMVEPPPFREEARKTEASDAIKGDGDRSDPFDALSLARGAATAGLFGRHAATAARRFPAAATAASGLMGGAGGAGASIVANPMFAPVAAGVVAFGSAIAAATIAVRQHSNAVEDLVETTSGALTSALQSVSQARIQQARSARSFDVAPMLTREFQQQADTTIAFEEMRSEIAEFRVQLLGPFRTEAREMMQGMSGMVASIFEILNSAGVKAFAETAVAFMYIASPILYLAKRFFKLFIRERNDDNLNAVLRGLNPANQAAPPQRAQQAPANQVGPGIGNVPDEFGFFD